MMDTDSGDKIVDSVRSKFLNRSVVGQKKYGTTMERKDLTALQWFTHLQEELMDATLYIERIISSEIENKD